MIRVLDSAGSTLVEWGRQQQQQQRSVIIIIESTIECSCVVLYIKHLTNIFRNKHMYVRILSLAI